MEETIAAKNDVKEFLDKIYNQAIDHSIETIRDAYCESVAFNNALDSIIKKLKALKA